MPVTKSDASKFEDETGGGWIGPTGRNAEFDVIESDDDDEIAAAGAADQFWDGKGVA